MKARAGLFTLLIGMISLVGFGHTTDPSENSICVNQFSESSFVKMDVVQLANADILISHFNEVSVVLTVDSELSFKSDDSKNFNVIESHKLPLFKYLERTETERLKIRKFIDSQFIEANNFMIHRIRKNTNFPVAEGLKPPNRLTI